MHRIDSAGTVAGLPAPGAVGGTVGYFTEGNALTGVPATVVSADWLNATQEEIANAIEATGIVLDKTVRTQLKDAIDRLVNGGGTTKAVVFADSPYTAAIAKRKLKVDTSGGAVTVNLPAAAGVDGFEFSVVKTTADVNAVTVDANGAETINGELTQVIDQQWTMLTFTSIGTGWVIK